MNDADLISKLEKVDLSDIVIPNHQRRLGEALHNSGCFKESKIMAILKRTSPVGGAIAVAAVVAAVVVGVKLSTSVSAQQSGQGGQTNKQTSVGMGSVARPPAMEAMMQAVRNFSRLSLEEKLQQAQSAKDLTKLTSEQYLSQNPDMAGMKPPRGNGKTLAELDLTYLQFTASFGGSCVIGVDKDTGLPVMAVGGGGGSSGSGVAGGSGGGGFGPGNGAFGPPRGMGAGPGSILVGGSSTGSGSSAVTTTNTGPKTFTVNGKEIKLPPGTDPNHVRIEMRNDKVYIDGKEIPQ